MRNKYMQSAMSGVRYVIQHLKDQPHLQRHLRDSLTDMRTADFVYEHWIQDAKMIGVRNPAFDGDQIGYPEDDLKSDDETNEDDENDKKPPAG